MRRFNGMDLVLAAYCSMMLYGCLTLKNPAAPTSTDMARPCAKPVKVPLVIWPEEPATTITAGEDRNVVDAKLAVDIANLRAALREQQYLIVQAQGK
jgi:hypothetical protein